MFRTVVVGRWGFWRSIHNSSFEGLRGLSCRWALSRTQLARQPCGQPASQPADWTLYRPAAGPEIPTKRKIVKLPIPSERIINIFLDRDGTLRFHVPPVKRQQIYWKNHRKRTGGDRERIVKSTAANRKVHISVESQMARADICAVGDAAFAGRAFFLLARL